MKIFINIDNRNSNSLKTKEELIKISQELKIEITNEMSECDLIISIGGDGTFLKSARLSCEKPLIGIHTGTLGFLTEISPKNIKQTLNEILNENYYIEERMMLEGEIIRKDGKIEKIPKALNEIGISKNIIGVMRFDVLVNEKLINSYTANGILVCTPTGSTAYNLSCGGPIVDPTARILTLTPIDPHSVNNRSIVLSDESIVEIQITELRDNTTSFVLYDDHPIEVFNEDKVKIKKSDKITKIIKLEKRSFIDTLRENIN
ncbi:NAD(+)/NADH kinase [Methanobrevibacter sp.]|uniref:NAD(+)/NADH kinase n=1 Tax=Methanobrevibacter sp. TaxID=66852 RepID=UPI003890232A